MPLGMELGLGPGHIVLDGDPAPPKRGTAAPTLQPMSKLSIVVKRSPILATAELLFQDQSMNQFEMLCHSIKYTVSHKKGANLFFSITLSKINGF